MNEEKCMNDDFEYFKCLNCRWWNGFRCKHQFGDLCDAEVADFFQVKETER